MRTALLLIALAAAALSLPRLFHAGHPRCTAGSAEATFTNCQEQP